MKAGTLLLGIASLASLVAPGCGTADPNVRAVEAIVAERSDAGYVVAITLEGENPNDIELPLRFIDYTVDIDGKRVFSGRRSPEATLRRKGTQRFEIAAAAPVAAPEGVPTGVRRWRVSGSLGYIAPGAFAETLFDLGVRRPTVGFAGSGEIDFSAPAPEPTPPSAGAPGGAERQN